MIDPGILPEQVQAQLANHLVLLQITVSAEGTDKDNAVGGHAGGQKLFDYQGGYRMGRGWAGQIVKGDHRRPLAPGQLPQGAGPDG